mmetsp:Transcript_8213/g.23612  ORF Transcript_8213/g.23612 Transcript_8213/m.23612 type:complete len:209 (-) Transcript_8213:17-643(-)
MAVFDRRRFLHITFMHDIWISRSHCCVAQLPASSSNFFNLFVSSLLPLLLLPFIQQLLNPPPPLFLHHDLYLRNAHHYRKEHHDTDQRPALVQSHVDGTSKYSRECMRCAQQPILAHFFRTVLRQPDVRQPLHAKQSRRDEPKRHRNLQGRGTFGVSRQDCSDASANETGQCHRADSERNMINMLHLMSVCACVCLCMPVCRYVQRHS